MCVCVCVFVGGSQRKSLIYVRPPTIRDRQTDRESKVQCKLFPLYKSGDNMLITYKSACKDRVRGFFACLYTSPQGLRPVHTDGKKCAPHSETEWQHHGVWFLQVAAPHPNPGPLHHLQASKHCMFPHKQTEHKSTPLYFRTACWAQTVHAMHAGANGETLVHLLSIVCLCIFVGDRETKLHMHTQWKLLHTSHNYLRDHQKSLICPNKILFKDSTIMNTESSCVSDG